MPSSMFAMRPATLFRCCCSSSGLRYFQIMSRDNSVYKSPWDRPDHTLVGAVVTHIDASADQEGNSGGAIAWVTRNTHGEILDQGSKWVSGVVDPTQLEWSGLIEYTSMKPKVGICHTICVDNNGVVLRLEDESKGLKVEKESMAVPAKIVWQQLQENFPPDTTVKWISRSGNRLADSLAQVARLYHLDKVSVCE